MAKKTINLGTALNDGTGDALRVGAQKINDNFTELYTVLGGQTDAPLSIVSKLLAGDGIIVSSATGDILVTNKPATTNTLGGIRAGTGITVDLDGVASVNVYELPKSSSTILGGIKVGDRLSIDSQGVLSADPGAYTLPKATGSALGGIKIGVGLSIDGGGIVSVSTSDRLISGLSEVVLDAEGDLNIPGTITSSTPINIIAGGNALDLEINYVQLQWASDVANPDNGKNQYIWAAEDGAHINTSMFGTEGIVYDNQWWFKNDGVFQLPVGGDIVDSTGTSVLGGNGGLSAYEIAVDNGFDGTEQEWLDSLVGADGAPGANGQDGAPGAPGADGQDGVIETRTTVSATTASLANNATGNLTITGFKGYVLYKIQTSVAAWVRIYTDSASRTADASRSQTTDPSLGSGVIAEVITTGAETILISPGTIGFSNESTPSTNIQLAVTNKSGSTGTVTVTLTVLQIEA
jgi:hypothetical protein